MTTGKPPSGPTTPPDTPDRTRVPAAQQESQLAVDVCPRCSESVNLALIKGCLRCMKCGFKWDCNGW